MRGERERVENVNELEKGEEGEGESVEGNCVLKSTSGDG